MSVREAFAKFVDGLPSEERHDDGTLLRCWGLAKKKFEQLGDVSTEVLLEAMKQEWESN